MKKFLFLLCTYLIPFTALQASSTDFLQRAQASVMMSADIRNKDEVLTLLEILKNNGCIIEKGSDDLRTKYVHAQGIIEQALSAALALGEIKTLVGTIHAPMPATPLCTTVNNLDTQLLDPSIRDDQDKLLTVRARAVIIRDFLDKGGVLYIAYPKGGLEKRTPEQQAIYKKELERHPMHLFDVPLKCSEMDPENIGATYIFKTAENKMFAFSIKSYQASDPSVAYEWGLWLGPVEDPNVFQRLKEVFGFLRENS